MSDSYQEVLTWVIAYKLTLLADDPRFGNEVELHHMDGSTFILQNAFVVLREDYVAVFSEHHLTMVYPSDEVEYAEGASSGGNCGRPF